MVDLFGYVRPRKSELLVREWEAYRGVYCAMCRSLGKNYGAAAKLALNYDCTFYAVFLLSALPKPLPRFQTGRCAANPLKKCPFCRASGGEVENAAALTVLLAYHKVLDDLSDSGMWEKLLHLLPYPAVRRACRKAARSYPELAKIVSDAMERQREAERMEDPGIDLCAEPTAGMLARIFESAAAAGNEAGSPRARIFRRFGYCLGRWIYLMDAADDLADDVRTGAFNPFAVRFRIDARSAPQEIERARGYANGTLNQTLSQLGAAANLLEMNELGPIVRNVVFLGLPQMQKELLFKKEKTNARSL